VRASQYGESDQIARHFGARIGRFLDIGAYDGITFSNTWPLALSGWSGVCVEPAPGAFVALMNNYQGNGLVQLVNVGLAPVAGLYQFWANAEAGGTDALSSFRYEHVKRFPHLPWREMWAYAVTWDTLLRAHEGSYQFVNIDVEGMNPEILTGLCDRMAIVQPEMVCVELDPAAETDWMKWKLERAGLSKQEVVGGNLLASK